VLAGLAAIGGGLAAGYLLVQREPWEAAKAAGGAAFAFVFWRWMHLGARARLVERDAAGGHGPEGAEPTRIGPWGVVGGVLTALVVTALVGLGVWATIAGRADQRAAEEARDEAVRVARRRGLTVLDVRAALATESTAAWQGEVSQVVAGLLPLEHGTVIAASDGGDHASLLIRPADGDTVCAVVDITHGDLVRGRLTDHC